MRRNKAFTCSPQTMQRYNNCSQERQCNIWLSLQNSINSLSPVFGSPTSDSITKTPQLFVANFTASRNLVASEPIKPSFVDFTTKKLANGIVRDTLETFQLPPSFLKKASSRGYGSLATFINTHKQVESQQLDESLEQTTSLSHDAEQLFRNLPSVKLEEVREDEHFESCAIKHSF